MKIFIVIIISFGYLFLTSCTKDVKIIKPVSVQDSTIYNFINEIIPLEKEIFSLGILQDISEASHINIWDIKNNFSKEDTAFINMQIVKNDTFVFKQELLKEKVIVTPRDSIQKILSKKKDNSFNGKVLKNLQTEYGFCYIDKPVFSSDLSTCLVTYGFYCGPKCAREKTTVFKRENGNWGKFKIISEIVS